MYSRKAVTTDFRPCDGVKENPTWDCVVGGLVGDAVVGNGVGIDVGFRVGGGVARGGASTLDPFGGACDERVVDVGGLGDDGPSTGGPKEAMKHAAEKPGSHRELRLKYHEYTHTPELGRYIENLVVLPSNAISSENPSLKPPIKVIVNVPIPEMMDGT